MNNLHKLPIIAIVLLGGLLAASNSAQADHYTVVTSDPYAYPSVTPVRPFVYDAPMGVRTVEVTPAPVVVPDAYGERVYKYHHGLLHDISNGLFGGWY